MAATRVDARDLARDPLEVAGGLVAWQRGDEADAVAMTLERSAADLTNRHYTLWVWAGATPAGEPAWALAVPARVAAGFVPRLTARRLVACLETAVRVLGADAARVRLEDWRGFTCLVLPGVEEELAEIAVEETHRPSGRGRLAWLPPGVALGGPPIPLRPDAGAAGETLTEVARALGVHPVEAALELLRRDLPLEGDPAAMADALRDWSVAPPPPEPPPPPPAASLAIADDPCPLRRHARVVLQRMLRMGKVGMGYHTDIANFARGAAAHERHQALDVAEALLRAGLLGEKPSVGQRHIYLSVKALPDIHALIERGETRDPQLAAMWTAPEPGAATAAPGPSP
ncbi:hypothetical protein [Miltoncostaea marina]|uniref:hypothetical protein n=1 Tax=Miltoncostaea marina TaxID=2843215 RepID=UPI001C3E816B|nr:hypothetical protein [Miltoncostaea marina]